MSQPVHTLRYMTEITDNSDLWVGDDGKLRCGWGTSDPLYIDYHDHEWGRPLRDERAMFELMSLEAFQSGLSWLTILRKRPGFREAFDEFEPDVVAAYGDDDVARLLADPGIVRNRAKVEATIANARAVVSLHEQGGSLVEVVFSHSPGTDERPPGRFRGFSEVPKGPAHARLPIRRPHGCVLADAGRRRGRRPPRRVLG
jgi:DNA-3-methyladenine glycosylase I